MQFCNNGACSGVIKCVIMVLTIFIKERICLYESYYHRYRKGYSGYPRKGFSKCAQYNANVIEVTQSILQDLFCMIMLVDLSKLNEPFAELADAMTQLGKEENLSIHTMHEDIFNCMHHI